MPKTPILSRTGFFSVIRGPIGKTVSEFLDWNAVDTELGPMVEPRVVITAQAPIVQIDTNDQGYNEIVPIDSEQFTAQYGTGGYQLLRNVNA